MLDEEIAEAGDAAETEWFDDINVLLVEDDESIAEMYRLKLELDGYRVRVASDGPGGLREATETPPDLLFLDLRLPGLDGLALLEQLRSQEKTAELPVVIITNYDEDELRQRGLRLGVRDYLIKSQISPGDLAGRVQHWTEPPDHD